jgi:putative intracellular protease/amidase
MFLALALLSGCATAPAAATLDLISHNAAGLTSPAAPRFGLHTAEGPRCLAKPVLLVLANRDFFYREYADPRSRLEANGYRVVVGAGTRDTCTPHQGSGQGAADGHVRPDVALSAVNPSDYSAICFAGGWGASSYPFAVPHRYLVESYNGTPAIRTEANRLIEGFAAQQKQVAGICHGVTVLAWARPGGATNSPLAGKWATGSAGPAPYRIGQTGPYDLSRTETIAQGAQMCPPDAIGDPASAHDDVAIDGKWITAQDDRSAARCGEALSAEIYLRPGPGAWLIRDGVPQ